MDLGPYAKHKYHNKRGYKKKPTKNKQKVKTPMPSGLYMCAGCGREHNLSIHHCYYGGGKRDNSSLNKCVEWLCWHCHQSSTGIHGTHSDGVLDKQLKVKHQERLMLEGMSIDEFRSLFGKSYIGG